jgi:hypothetical protein
VTFKNVIFINKWIKLTQRTPKRVKSIRKNAHERVGSPKNVKLNKMKNKESPETYRTALYELQRFVWRQMTWYRYIGLRWTAKDKVEAKWKIQPLTCPVICGNHKEQQSLKPKTIPKFETKYIDWKLYIKLCPSLYFYFLQGIFTYCRSSLKSLSLLFYLSFILIMRSKCIS